jgi:hypothetical protein
MATTAQYSTAPTIDVSQISTANTGRDGSGTTVEIAAGPTSASASGVGKRIVGILIQATGTTTAGTVRFFISVDGGTTKRLIEEVVVSAITVGASTPAFSANVPGLVGIVLPGQVSSNTQKLYASTEKGETFNVVVYGATY